MGYECIVCYERCKGPISCTRCNKLICKSHVPRLEDKCPNCRLQPFTFQEKRYIGELIALQIYMERQQMKKNKVFKCLVEGCVFEGKFHAMAKHKKKRHFTETLEEIIFPQEREKKMKRQTLRKLLTSKLSKTPNKNIQLAFSFYGKTQGKCSLGAILKLTQHLQICRNKACQKVILNDHSVFIGDIQRNQTSCPHASPLTTYY